MLILWAVMIGVFASLVLLPPGRPAAIGLGVAALAVAGLWVTRGDDFVTPVVVLSATGIALAAVAQAVRWAFGARMTQPTYLLFALGLLLSVISLGLYVLVG